MLNDHSHNGVHASVHIQTRDLLMIFTLLYTFWTTYRYAERGLFNAHKSYGSRSNDDCELTLQIY